MEAISCLVRAVAHSNAFYSHHGAQSHYSRRHGQRLNPRSLCCHLRRPSTRSSGTTTSVGTGSAGLERFVADVDLLFSRNALAFELTPAGQARRLLPAPLAEAIGWTLFPTGDGETDRLLEAGRRRIVSPRPEDRQDSLEKLWDAFERLKTLEPGANKRVQADALLDRVAAPNSAFRQLLARKAVELTSIGNSFRIRHSEITHEALTSPDQIDYLFMRMFSRGALPRRTRRPARS